MSESSHGDGYGPRHRQVEIGVAAATAVFGAVVMAGSLQVGITWAVEGPRAGFFPFYVGLLILAASGVNAMRAMRTIAPGKLFASWKQLRSVASVVVPTAVYVLLLPHAGIYLSSALLIAVFMIWLGRYAWRMTLAVSVGMPFVTYFLFERWFLIPLPKGPIENMLGL
ncbi:MAG: tripartite tricarboxylate transporter TctB family protein [Alphaproteobacteria bacterium]|nr:tripartite tricarboxylate transporter TctB family protein [Alphaproteobacteria bacterium]